MDNDMDNNNKKIFLRSGNISPKDTKVNRKMYVRRAEPAHDPVRHKSTEQT